MKKKIFICFSLFIVAISLVGCGMENTPKKKVEKLLNSYQNNGESGEYSYNPKQIRIYRRI